MDLYEETLAAMTMVLDLQETAASASVGGGVGTIQNGTASAMTQTGPTAWLPNSLRFNGTNQFVTTTAKVVGDSLTLAAWVRPSSTGDTCDIIAQATGGPGMTTTGSASLNNDGSALNRSLVRLSGSYASQTGSARVADVWIHLAEVWADGFLTLYQNGVAVGSPVAAAVTTLADTSVTIASRLAEGFNFYDGDIAQAIAGPAVSPEAIAALYAGPTATATLLTRRRQAMAGA